MEIDNTKQLPQTTMGLDNTNDTDEIDNEGAMAKADLFKLGKYSYKLFKKLEDDDQLESWVQAKITKAADYIASVFHYMEYEMEFNDYAHKLENSDMLSEDQKDAMNQKLIEAKEKIKELKLFEAKKSNKNPVAKNINKFNKPSVEDDKKKESKNGKIKHKKQLDDQEQLDEISNDAYDIYKSHSGEDARKADQEGDYERANKRFKGIIRATKGQFRNDAKKHDKVKESSPSSALSSAKKSAVVKAAKDIGKPGEKFAKVANKAGGGEKGKKIAAASMWKNIKEGIANDTRWMGDDEPTHRTQFDDPEDNFDPSDFIKQEFGDRKHVDLEYFDDDLYSIVGARWGGTAYPIKDIRRVAHKYAVKLHILKNTAPEIHRKSDLDEQLSGDETGPTQIEQLTAMLQQYKNTAWYPQIEYRYNWLKTQLDGGDDVTLTGRQLGTSEMLPSPEQWQATHEKEARENGIFVESGTQPSQINESAELIRMKEVLTRLNG